MGDTPVPVTIDVPTITVDELFGPFADERAAAQTAYVDGAVESARRQTIATLATLSGLEEPEGDFVDTCIEHRTSGARTSAEAEVASNGPLEPMRSLGILIGSAEGSAFVVEPVMITSDPEQDPRILALFSAAKTLAGVELFRIDGEPSTGRSQSLWGVRFANDSGTRIITPELGGSTGEARPYDVTMINGSFVCEVDSMGRQSVGRSSIEWQSLEVPIAATSSGQVFVDLEQA